MTIDVIHQKANYQAAVFFTGDSDFLALVTYLRNGGKQVHIFSSKNNISHELKTGGDGYIDVLTIEEDIWGRELARRADRAAHMNWKWPSLRRATLGCNTLSVHDKPTDLNSIGIMGMKIN